MSDILPEHVAENRRYWDGMAHDWVVSGEQAWAGEARWGTWAIPNAELPLLPDIHAGNRCWGRDSLADRRPAGLPL